jgi:predicted DNA repair protein MutK
MSGLIGYIAALADDLSVVATKVAAGSLDDIANQTAKSLSQTAGLLVDGLSSARIRFKEIIHWAKIGFF